MVGNSPILSNQVYRDQRGYLWARNGVGDWFFNAFNVEGPPGFVAAGPSDNPDVKPDYRLTPVPDLSYGFYKTKE